MSRLSYNDRLHEYRYDGRIISGVTGVISRAGMTMIPPSIDPAVARKRMLGRDVHLACARLDLRGAPGEMDDECAGYLEGYRKFLREIRVEWLRVEFAVLIRVGGIYIGGRLDREGLLNGSPFILDIKTPASPNAAWGIQLAGYDLGLPPPRIKPWRRKRAALLLRPNGKYKLELYEDPSDYDVFMAAATDPNHPAVLKWKRNHNISIEEEDYEA